MKRLLASLFLFASIGCAHSQVKPTAFQVDLTFTAPVASGSWLGCGTGQPTCAYVASRITLPSGTTTCPAANVSTPNYVPLNSATPVSTLSYVDTTATGLTVAYIVQTEQAGAVSLPSNCAGPFVLPASPLAPSLTGNQTVAEMMPVPSGNSAAPVLTAKLTPVR